MKTMLPKQSCRFENKSKAIEIGFILKFISKQQIELTLTVIVCNFVSLLFNRNRKTIKALEIFCSNIFIHPSIITSKALTANVNNTFQNTKNFHKRMEFNSEKPALNEYVQKGNRPTLSLV